MKADQSFAGEDLAPDDGFRFVIGIANAAPVAALMWSVIFALIGWTDVAVGTAAGAGWLLAAFVVPRTVARLVMAAVRS